MRMRELKNALIESLTPRLLEYGFTYVPRYEAYAREYGDVTHQYQVRFIPLKPGFEIEPGIGVRVARVEEIFHRVSGFEPRYQRDTPTVGAEVWRLEGEPKSYRYNLSSYDDVAPVATQLYQVFLEKALTYYDAYSSLESIDSLLNDTPQEKTPHRMMEWLRASTGLIVARLRGRLNYNELVDLYRKKVARLDNGFYLPRYEALVSELERSDPATKSST